MTDLPLATAAEPVEPAGTPPRADGHRDRLGELADWWATVSEQPSPRTAELFWATEPPPVATPEALVSLHPYDVPESVADAVIHGTAVADAAVDAGADLVLLSVPAPSGAVAVLCAHLLDLDPVDAQGWPRAEGLTDVEWMTRVKDLRDGLRRLHRTEAADDVAERLGDPALAAGAGVVLRCAARRTPLLVEGLAGLAAGLLAHRANRTSRQWWLPVDGPSEGAPLAGLHDKVLVHLRRDPLLRLGLADDDTTAVRLGLTLLETALA